MPRLVTPAILLAVAATFALASTPARFHDRKLVHGDRNGFDEFGNDVGADGTLAIIGVRNEDPNVVIDAGSVYLFRTTTGAELAKLTASDGESDDFFGFSVDVDRGLAIVGAAGDDDNGSFAGSAYLFSVTNPAAPTETAKLLPAIPGHLGFGSAVAISGSLAIVGSFFDPENGSEAGSAYVFDVSDPNNPVELAKIVPAAVGSKDYFGESVALDGSLALIGAWGDDDTANNAGAAYLYDLTDPANPVLAKKILASDGGSSHEFGRDLAIEGSTAIIGAARNAGGTAYLFDLTVPTAPVERSSFQPCGVTPFDNFARAVDISGDTVIVGAVLDSEIIDEAGAAYLFDISDLDNPVELNKLFAGDAAPMDSFGRDVAITPASAVVGADREDSVGVIDSGSAYVFDLVPIPGCPGDVDGDGDTDVFDFSDMAANFGSGPGATREQGDLTGDGFVDVFDFGELAADFGCAS